MDMPGSKYKHGVAKLNQIITCHFIALSLGLGNVLRCKDASSSADYKPVLFLGP